MYVYISDVRCTLSKGLLYYVRFEISSGVFISKKDSRSPDHNMPIHVRVGMMRVGVQSSCVLLLCIHVVYSSGFFYKFYKAMHYNRTRSNLQHHRNQNPVRNHVHETTMKAGRMFSLAVMPESNDDTDTECNSSDISMILYRGCVVGDDNGWKNILSPEQCGFTKHYIQNRDALHCTPRAHSQATVSLALINRQCSILQKYANKLPIMTINVSRLLYTIEAFVFVSSDSPAQRNDCLRNALEFYIDTDLRCSDEHSKHLPANQKFSEFLHRLRSTGYLDFVFRLATRLNLNVDYVTSSSGRVVTRYLRVDYKAPAPTTSQISRKQTLAGIGYLTVVQNNENKWYVKTTKTPIINHPDV